MMKEPRMVLTLMLCSILAINAQTSPAFATASGEIHMVESELGVDHAQKILTIAQALFEQYNQVFQFDKGKLTNPFKIKWFANKQGFDAYLASKRVEGTRQDFVFLSWRDASKNELVAWGEDENWFKSFAFQGFIQYIWSFIPNPPIWLRNGFAYYYWDLDWDEATKSIKKSENLTFLDAAKSSVRSGAPDLNQILTLDEARVSANTDYLSWALVHYFSNTTNAADLRLFANVLIAISPTETLANNSRSVLNRITSARNLSDLNANLIQYLNGLQGFSSFMESGIERYRTGDWKAAKEFFNKALQLRPTDFRPHYYLGLTAYSEGDYQAAAIHYNNAKNLNPPPGLIPYALGLNSFYLRQFEDAASLLRQAIAENPVDYKANAEQVLALMQ